MASITVSIDLGPVYEADENPSQDAHAGTAIAAALREVADFAERSILVVPYPSGEWTDERHAVTRSGQHLATLRLKG